ncbi:MAG: hypothetical protein WDA71_12375 [Actinomycetota bacterium]
MSKVGERRQRLPLRWPFEEAVAGFRSSALATEGYDPAATFVWGQMMAVGVLELVKAVERSFGAEGQAIAVEALRSVGRRVGREMFEGAEIPAGLSQAQLVSLFASWINEVAYASVEEAWAEEDRVGFDIVYCPHQAEYGAFDCRIQRYLVEGMLEAARDLLGARGFDIRVEATIPAGAPACRFVIWQTEDERPCGWEARSQALGRMALEGKPGSPGAREELR